MSATALAATLAQALGEAQVPRDALPAVQAAALAWSRAVWDDALAAGARVPGAQDEASAAALLARPVFVCGTHRSGTTLVRNLLDDHPQLLVLPSEGLRPAALAQVLRGRDDATALAWYGQEWLRRMANPINLPPYWLLEQRQGQPPGAAAVDFARALMGWWPWCRQRFAHLHPLWPTMAVVLAYGNCVAAGPLPSLWRRWVEKTPTNECDAAALLRWFPQARVVQVVRPPDEVLASRRRLSADAQVSVPWRAIHDLRRSYVQAARALRVGLASGHAVIRYEQLLAAPAITMHELATFLGIDDSGTLLQATVNGLAAPANSSFGRQGTRGAILDRRDTPLADDGGAMPAAAGQGWREALAHAWLAPSAARLGYRLSGRRRNWRMKWSPN